MEGHSGKRDTFVAKIVVYLKEPFFLNRTVPWFLNLTFVITSFRYKKHTRKMLCICCITQLRAVR